MKEAIKRRHISFQNAWRGIRWVIHEHPNFRIHLVLSSSALALAYSLGISRIELIILIFTVLLGLSSEMINTAIESITDLVTKEWRSEAQIAKDVSAGMMFTIAIGAALIGSIIFYPYVSGWFIR
jgi:diacylglycerol kinase